MKSTQFRVVTVAALAVFILGGAAAWTQQASPASPHHVLLAPGELQWSDGPPSLPAGAKFAVMEGDPRNAGAFTMRLQLPANYRIPAHWHPADEHVTVISGTFNMGMGEKLDTAKGTALAAGGFAVMPTGMRHFAWTDGGAVIQLHGVGPWGINYVNPEDDPRKKK